MGPHAYRTQYSLAVKKSIVNVLLESADKACGRTKGRQKRKETWWWNDEIAKAVYQKRSLFKVWKKSRSEADRAAYNQVKKE